MTGPHDIRVPTPPSPLATAGAPAPVTPATSCAEHHHDDDEDCTAPRSCCR